MYDLILAFFVQHVFNPSNDQGLLTSRFEFHIGDTIVSSTFRAYLCHLCTIASMIALFILACLFIRWVVRVFAGLFNRI